MKLIVKMLITLTIIGIISGGVLSQVSSWAKPKIAEHRKAATEKAIFLVQPEAKTYETITSGDFEAYKVFDENKKYIGYALPYEGSGFQGNVRLMVGVKADLTELCGLIVLEQIETPGLGTKIVEDASVKEDPLWFPNQFKGVKYAPEVVAVKGAEASKPNEIQAITGATISAKAVVDIVNAGVKHLREVDNAGGAK